MRSPAIRHVVRLRLTLVGPVPEIWREIIIDRDLSLADLRTVIPALFDGQTCHHHLFTDSLDSPAWSRARRRWGDRSTMIDLRDPAIIDEATALVGRVMTGARPLYYGHTCEGGSLIEIETLEDDIVAASEPSVRVAGGDRGAPLPCVRNAYEHAVLVGVLDDPDHPGRAALEDAIEHAVGPWSTFDPEHFDPADAQRRVDALLVPTAGAAHRPEDRGPLAQLVKRLPRPARSGLERHLATSGIDLPTVVTTDDAEIVTRAFAWVIGRAANGGIPIVDGAMDPAVVQAGAQALGCIEDRVRKVVALAKRGRLLYSRGGRLLANKRSTAAARTPGDLWSLLAHELVRTVAPRTPHDLFLLAVADGSLADPALGLRRSAEARDLIRRDSAHGGPAYYGYDGYGRHEDHWRSEGDPRAGCEQTCDCPSGVLGTWHDLVSQAIRDAAAASADEGALVATRFTAYEARGAGIEPDWLEPGLADEAVAWPYGIATRTVVQEPADVEAFLREVDELVELLSLLGMERADDGTWIVPPTLREFARDCLRGRGGYPAF